MIVIMKTGLGTPNTSTSFSRSSSSGSRGVYYCCVSKGSQIVCASTSTSIGCGSGSGSGSGSGGDTDIENLAALCLENIPPYHAWYIETFGKRTFGFLALGLDNGNSDDHPRYTCFAIADEAFGNLGTLHFLQQVKDHFNKLAYSSTNYLQLQERFLPILLTLINSSEQALALASPAFTDIVGDGDWPSGNGINMNPQIEITTSTKAPLLLGLGGRSNGSISIHEEKNKKKKMKNSNDHKDHHHILVELEEHRRSARASASASASASATSDGMDPNSNSISNVSISRPKDLGVGSIRNRPGSQSMRKKWWHQIRIVLAIDAIVCVCIALFLIWLLIFLLH